MSIYNVGGNLLSDAYGADGNLLNGAYSVNGNLVFPDSPISLKIATYNVGGWYIGSGENVPTAKASAYLEMQNNVFANVDADIICLEEYWTYFSGTTRAANAILNNYYPYSHGVNGTDQYFGRCICSKYPIVDYTENYFLDDVKRYYDVATINVYGRLIQAFVTHLSTSSNPQVRADEAAVIYDYIAAQGFDNFLVFGDFNVGVTSPLSEYNLEVFGDFLNDGCDLANGGTFGVFETYSRNSTYTDNLTVDNIIISDAFEVKSVGVDLTKVIFQSTNGDKIDHIPLYAVVEHGATPTPTYETIYESASLAIASNGDGTGYAFIADLISVTIADGSSWRITIDGHADECTAEFISQLNVYGIPYYNANNVNDAILFNNGSGWIVYMLNQDSGTISLKVEQAT